MPAASLGWIVLFVGGGLGAVLRHAIAVGIDRLAAGPPTSHFPYATLTANLIGCLAIGLLAEWAGPRPMVRLGLIVGLLGGFTTYSSFALDTVRLVATGRLGQAGVYVLLTNAAGITAAALAYRATGGGPIAALDPD